ncbi:MAG: bifunctional DNA primase/polymerase [Desulfamplus sp.]|nr:bifunctional DNA primase/polymerase [Desulfamplus sp.]
MNEKLEHYRKLSENFSLLPLEYNTLSPSIKRWRKRCNKKKNFVDDAYIDKKYGVRNAGIACGPASNILVVTCKDKAEVNVWCKFNDIENPFPETFTITYGGVVDYFFYQYPKDGKVYRTTSIIPCLEVLGVGSFIPLPPVVDPTTQVPYFVLTSAPVALLPQWVLEVLSGNFQIKTLESEINKTLLNFDYEPFKISNPKLREELALKARKEVLEKAGIKEQEVECASLDNSLVEKTNKVFEIDTIDKFIEQMCKIDKSLDVKSSAFNNAYEKWCKENSLKKLGKHSITTVMKEKGFTKKKKDGDERWFGLDIK